MKRTLVTIILIISTLLIQAQNPKIDKARALVNSGKPEKAITLLTKYFNKSADKKAAIEIIAIYNLLNDSPSALKWAEKAGINKSVEQNDIAQYVDLLIREGQFQKALEVCKSYALENDNIEAIGEMAYMSENLLRAQKRAVLYNVNEAIFNSGGDEISIANYRSHYVISSNGYIPLSSGNLDVDFFDFHILQKDYDKWRYPSYLLKDQDRNTNKTTLCYTTNGNEVYYTAYNVTQLKKKKKKAEVKPIKFGIYHAESIGNEWVNTALLSFQDEQFSYKDPALHPNGNLLVFSANFKGNFDLYYSTLVDDTWSVPISLGKNVNSEKEETKPYFDKSGQLYFSSNRIGFGGYDIYKTLNDGGIWIKPDILSPPINSKYDDFSLIYGENQSFGYFVSNRPKGSGGYDIYEFRPFNIKLSVSVLDKGNGTLLPYSEIQLMQDGILLDQKLTDEKGYVEFRVGNGISYDLVVKKETYKLIERSVQIDDLKDGDIQFSNVQLERDDNYIDASKEKEVKFNNQNFIEFKAIVVDKNNQQIPDIKVKMINMKSGKMKILQTDKAGAIQLSLYLGNTYKLIYLFQGKEYIQNYSTESVSQLKSHSDKCELKVSSVVSPSVHQIFVCVAVFY